jgi:hypothetical protein
MILNYIANYDASAINNVILHMFYSDVFEINVVTSCLKELRKPET